MSEENAIKEQGQQAEGATTQEQTGSESVTDKHGQQGINLERHKREIAEKDAKIAELQAKVDEAAKTEEGRNELKKELEALRAEFAEKELSYKLQAAGARNVKAAKALLGEYDNDVEKLKAAEAWLFTNETKGTTGAKPAGAPTSGGEEEDEKLDRAMGLKRRKD